MKRILSPAILLFLSVFIPLNLLSQKYEFQHITTVNGLSHNEVRKIVKDSNGFLWLGTQNGLSRYDGNNFKVYKASNSDSTSAIHGDKIYSLAASSKKIWIGTTTGLSVLNAKTGAVLDNEIPDSLYKDLKESFIYSIFSDSNDDVWLSSGAGNYIINTTDYSLLEILDGYYVYSFKEASDKNMWIGTNKGAVLYNSGLQQIIETYPEVGHVTNFYTDKFGILWAASASGIFRFVPEKNHFLKMFSKHSVNAITETRDGDMLFSSYGGALIVYHRNTEEFYRLSADPKNQKSLSSNDLYDVLVDKEGLVWVGTQEGLDVYDWTRTRFNRLVRDPDNINSLSDNFVQSIYKDQDNGFWFGTRSEGVNRAVFENENYKNPIFEHIHSNTNDPNSLWGNTIWSMLEDSKNRFWIASGESGVNLYNKKEKTFQHFTHNSEQKNSLASNQVKSILEDDKGRIWFGTSGGLSLMKEADNGQISFRNFHYEKYDGNSLSLNSIYKVFQDSKKRIWIGMNNGGVCLLHEESDNRIWFEGFRHDNNDESSLSSDEVFVIYEDSQNRIWFGTSSAGVNLLLEEPVNSTGEIKYSFKRYTEDDGLSDNEVNSILEDGNSKLWMATNKGFSHLDTDTDQFVNYSTYDGVLKGKFRKNSAYKNSDGTLFFGGAAGVNYFNPDNFKKNKIEPRPQFTALFLDGKKIEMGQIVADKVMLYEELNSGATINLSEKYNRFEIHYSALSFASPLRNKYKYKLEGIDKDWIETSSENLKASYFDLPGGDYKFLLKACNNDGLWNSKPIYLNIIVEATFLGTLSKNSNIIAIVIGVLILGFFFRYRKKEVKIKSKTKVEPLKIKKEKSVDAIAEENKIIVVKLMACMEVKKLYMNPLLNLQVLADELQITSNQLSLVLNDCLGKSFYDFVNFYRVEEVKRRLIDSKYKHQTLLSISGDCGFNSKSAFNRIFKNFTGKTPSQFQKKIKE